MQTFTIDEAKTDLQRLVEQAADGEPFIIANEGKPMVKVVALEPPEVVSLESPTGSGRLGGLEGKVIFPDDIKAFGRAEIEQMFYGEEE